MLLGLAFQVFGEGESCNFKHRQQDVVCHKYGMFSAQVPRFKMGIYFIYPPPSVPLSLPFLCVIACVCERVTTGAICSSVCVRECVASCAREVVGG